MKKPEKNSEIGHRDAVKLLTAGSAAGILGLLGTRSNWTVRKKDGTIIRP